MARGNDGGVRGYNEDRGRVRHLLGMIYFLFRFAWLNPSAATFWRAILNSAGVVVK